MPSNGGGISNIWARRQSDLARSPLQDRRPVDIVAIPLATEELRGSVSLLPVNDLAPGKLAIMVGMEVFILGYPFGSALPAFPVWKR